jgi:hypothetical protein
MVAVDIKLARLAMIMPEFNLQSKELWEKCANWQ